MNWRDWLLWSFVATLALTSVMAGSQGLRLTRMNLPYMLGTMFTPNRDRAKLIGFVLHLLNGWIFSLAYVAAFQSWGRATWWAGAAIGLVQAVVRADRGDEPAAEPPPAHGQRAEGAYRYPPARAARLPGAQLRIPDAGLGGARACDLRGDSGSVLFRGGR